MPSCDSTQMLIETETIKHVSHVDYLTLQIHGLVISLIIYNSVLGEELYVLFKT